jgi:hypothetical protein
MCEYSKMILILFLILIVVYLLPMYPKPRVYHDFITPEERRHIIQKCEKNLEPSLVSEERRIDEKMRKSETAWLGRGDPVVDAIIKRCLKNTDRPIVNCERLQVLRYKPGGFYEPHQDVIEGDKNPRMYTFILALNDDYEGGETVFPNLNKAYKLKAGDALFFDTLDNYEMETSKALHGGNPVKSGEKWICNLWVRKYPYTT